MIQSSNLSIGLAGLLHSLSYADRVPPRPDMISSLSIKASCLCRVLILETRDEVFRGLKALFYAHGVRVTRAESATALAERAAGFCADLVLINADLPGESGWLACAKLRLQRQKQQLWVYADQTPTGPEQCTDLSGANETIVYGGVLAELHAEIQNRLERSPLCLSADADFDAAKKTA